MILIVIRLLIMMNETYMRKGNLHLSPKSEQCLNSFNLDFQVFNRIILHEHVTLDILWLIIYRTKNLYLLLIYLKA